MNNWTVTTNATNATFAIVPHAHYMARTATGAVIAALVLLGNAYCLFVFLRNKSLRGRPFYLLINLCVADLLVGFSVLLRMLENMSRIIPLSIPLHLLYFGYTLDYFSNLVSVYLLAAISIERLIAVVFPFYVHYSGFWMYVVLIGSPWTVTVACTAVYIFTYRIPLLPSYRFDLFYVICVYAPVILIFICYSALAIKMKCSRMKAIHGSNERQRLRDKKLAVTFLIVTLASIVTWDPYIIYYTLTYHCSFCGVSINWDVFFSLLMLQYCNSIVNVVVYMSRIKEFRRGLFCHQRPRFDIRPNVRVHPETVATRV